MVWLPVVGHKRHQQFCLGLLSHPLWEQSAAAMGVHKSPVQRPRWERTKPFHQRPEPRWEPREATTLQVNVLAPVQPSDILTATSRDPKPEKSSPAASKILAHKYWDIVNIHCCFKPLSFRIICNAATDDDCMWLVSLLQSELWGNVVHQGGSTW